VRAIPGPSGKNDILGDDQLTGRVCIVFLLLRTTAASKAITTIAATTPAMMMSRLELVGGVGGTGWTGFPTAMFVPVKAETGIWPQIIPPFTVIPVALVQAVPLQYCIVVLELAEA
jgi:hypothetical protein